MADSERCDLIEAWAREALAEAVDDLPDDAEVRVEARGDDTYGLTVEVPQGEGAQQLANSIQSKLTELVEGDPTLGDRFHQATVSPAGVDLVASGDAGARSMWELKLAVPDEESGEDDEDDEDDEKDGSGEDGEKDGSDDDSDGTSDDDEDDSDGSDDDSDEDDKSGDDEDDGGDDSHEDDDSGDDASGDDGESDETEDDGDKSNDDDGDSDDDDEKGSSEDDSERSAS